MLLYKKSKYLILLAVILSTKSSFVSSASLSVDTNSDYAWYANQHSITLEEAKKRIVAIQEATDIANVLAEDDPDFAGAYIDDSLGFKIVFNYKKSLNIISTNLNELLKERSWAKFASIKYVKYSLNELNKIKDDQISLLKRNQEKSINYVNIKENKVSSQILNLNFYKTRSLNTTAPNLPSSNSDAVILESIDKLPEMTQWGGNTIFGSNGGRCTSGFVVKNASNVLGVTTAQHCATPTMTLGSSTITRMQVNPARDVAWFRLPANLLSAASNRIRVGTGYRLITAVQEIKNTMQGSPACLSGAASGYKCGKIVGAGLTATFQNPDGSYTDKANLILVTKNGVKGGGSISNSGDSGGPLFYNNTAYGSVSAGAAGDSGTYASSVASIQSLGVRILTQ